jgi:acetylornithine deacetylase/succinyl-diaminopimelate desuccinylase-like protein
MSLKDMKGAALPFLLAYRDVCAQGDVPPVSILLTSDEETGGTTIPDLLRTGSLRAPIAFTPDTGSSPGIVTEHKGVVWADLLAEGTGGHGALPWESGNPIPLLALAIQRLTDAFPSGTAEDWQMTVSVTELEGGQAMNQIPKRARATLDIRYPPGECADAADACRRLESYLPAGCSLRVRLEAAPLSTDPDHPFIREFISIVEHVEGAAPLRIREHGATDARHFGAAGIPAFLYGPRGGGIHGDGEWVSLQSLEEHYRLYRELFDRLGTS